MAQDQPLSPSDIYKTLSQKLGREKVSQQVLYGRKVIVYGTEGRKIILLTKCITYLGNPHPAFKKRIQLPDWYQEFCTDIQNNSPEYDVRFLGVYHYSRNIVFVDFVKDTYLEHGLHNSSAHVYINDLYQAMSHGIFRKEDKSGNTIVAIRNDRLKDYLTGAEQIQDDIFDQLRKFNSDYPFGRWLYALDAIREMHDGEWAQWRQAEWAGWFLEYRFSLFTKEQNVEDKMRYVGNANKRAGDLDFDIHFGEADFYGDLKASDIKKSEAPGNDQKSLTECIKRYGKFWYVIYEHETIKDSDKGYEATRARNQYIKSKDARYDKGEMSYHRRMKHSVRFMKMTIIELNKVNYHGALKTFRQGRQADGTARAPKFNVDKKALKNDNYVVFRYTYTR